MLALCQERAKTVLRGTSSVVMRRVCGVATELRNATAVVACSFSSTLCNADGAVGSADGHETTACIVSAR